MTFKAMQAAAETNPKVAARVRLFQYRVVEEFYDFANDPDALHNLIDDVKYKKNVEMMHKELLEWMKRTDDPALEALRKHKSPDALKKFMAEQDTKAGRRQPKRKPRKNARREQTFS
ncbi:MAG: hypothetical protein ACYTEO_19345 [Planctomycetota bacterium]